MDLEGHEVSKSPPQKKYMYGMRIEKKEGLGRPYRNLEV